MINLREIEYDSFNDCINMEYSKDVEVNRFVESPIYTLAEAYTLRRYWTVYVIYNDDEIVGMVIIRNKPVEGNKPYGFSELFIADNNKRKGYGSEAVKIILDKLKNENGFKTVKICVHEENDAAFEFYKKIGFLYVGRTCWSGQYIELSITP